MNWAQVTSPAQAGGLGHKSQVRHKEILFFVFLSLVLLPLAAGCQNKQLHKDKRVMMGTFVEVISADRRAANIAFGEIKRVESLLSKYDPDSEIARLNKAGELKVGSDTLYILKKAKEFWRSSGGAFDVTVGPLMDLWGFTDKKYRLPKPGKIKKTLNLIGMDKIIFKDTDNMIQFSIQGMKIDLGAIAKGYAVDCAVNKLKQAGVKSCLINAGGDIYCLGDKSGESWTVAIQDPEKENFTGYINLKDKAVATSGNYEQYFSEGKSRFGHIFNPKTGYPADSGVVSATVIAPDCLTADALATSVFVLGKTKGEELIKQFPGVELKTIEENE